MNGEHDILFAVEGAVGRVTLNRPEALNALTLGMVRDLDARLVAWAADAGVGAVVIEGVFRPSHFQLAWPTSQGI